MRRPGELSKLVGMDVRGFRHAASNQSMAHALGRHGVPSIERQRGQTVVSTADFQRLPQIVRSSPRLSPIRGNNSEPRVVYRTQIDGVTYTYVAEVRAGKRRLDMVTMYKK